MLSSARDRQDVLFMTDRPMVATARRLVHAVKRWVTGWTPYRPMPGGKDRLDAEYTRGSWDYLAGVSELSRFSVIVGYCHHLKPGGSILEVGCGEGLLAARLDRTRVAAYLGVDISAEAVRRAQLTQDEATAFMVADATRMTPRGRFDLIVFNECLEYLDDPLADVQRYAERLEPGGLVIVSIFDGIDTGRSRLIWRRLHAVFDRKAETRVVNEDAFAWTIKALQPRRPAA